MTMRAKFKVTSVKKTDDNCEIYLNAVVGGSEENDKFFKYTPAGSISLAIVNPDLIDNFSIDQEFYIDFNPA